jgi:hypothetical protein
MPLASASGPRALAAFALVTSCHSHAPAPPASTSAAPSARPVPSATVAAVASVPPPRPRVPGCRVLEVKGATPPPPGTPRVGTAFAANAWVDLAAGVELAVKHGETTREFRLGGPGRFLPCPDSEEEVIVARGTVLTTPGPGSRAGAEVVLATPFGVALYADAELRLDVTADKLTLAVKQGQATLNERVRPTSGTRSVHGKVDADALVKDCETARLKGAEPAPSDQAARGAWAAGMLQWHRRVRLRCARARAAAGRLDDPERARLEDLLEQRKSPAPGAAAAEKPAETDAGK